MPETPAGQHLLRQIRTLLLVILIIVMVFATVGSIYLGHQGNNIDKNTKNVNHLALIVNTTGKDARETRKALEKALRDAKARGTDASFTQEIKDGLEAIKRIEAKLDASGG